MSSPNPAIERHFERLFKTNVPARDNFRARLFAIFSEEIVRVWGAHPKAPYRDIGRPTLWQGDSFATLDFTLERRSDGLRFVAEQKAELSWAAYSQLRLVAAEQVARHTGKRAFDWFLDAARDPTLRAVKVAGRVTEVAGAILVWGAVEPEGRQAAMDHFGVADVLSLETMLADLAGRRDDGWAARVAELRAWSDGLLDGLLAAGGDGGEVSHAP